MIMAKDNTRSYIFYPLQILSRDYKWELDKFLPYTSINHIRSNIYETNHNGEKILYSIITDKPYWEDEDGNVIPEEIKPDGIIFGRLLRLRNEAVSMIDLDKLQEEVLANSPSHFLLESSYFVIDTKSNIMLGQYNKDSVNVLNKRAGEIFKNSLFKLNLNHNFDSILPIPTNQLIKVIIKNESSVHNYKLSLGSIDLEYLERFLGPASKRLRALADGTTFNFSATISFKFKPHFNDDRYEKINNLFIKNRDKKLEKLKVSTEDGIFDLLNNNFLYYPVTVEMPIIKSINDYKKLRNSIQKSMYDILSKNKDDISNKLPTLNDFYNI